MTWPPETMTRAEALLAKYPERRSAVMPLLYIAMREDGRLTDEGMRQVAALTGVTAVQVEAVASFYNMYLRHAGRHVVSVCRSISCYLLGSEALRDAIVDEAGTPEGETAADGSVTIVATECIGACGGAPAIQVDYEMVEGMTPESARRLVRWLCDDRPAAVRSDEMQDRFGGRRSFDPGSEDTATAIGPFPAFAPFGTVGGSGS
jgi:NADH-quinone oxidoreductase subunit E